MNLYVEEKSHIPKDKKLKTKKSFLDKKRFIV